MNKDVEKWTLKEKIIDNLLGTVGVIVIFTALALWADWAMKR